MPLCHLCEKTFSNDAMKPAKMKHHLETVHCDKKNKDLDYFKTLKEKLKSRSNIKTLFKAPVSGDTEGGLRASYNISLMKAKKGKAHTIATPLPVIPSHSSPRIPSLFSPSNSQPLLSSPLLAIPSLSSPSNSKPLLSQAFPATPLPVSPSYFSLSHSQQLLPYHSQQLLSQPFLTNALTVSPIPISPSHFHPLPSLPLKATPTPDTQSLFSPTHYQALPAIPSLS
ncbi:uncharacterized protein LOC135092568 [Scylla paramamosain]|uniref:uncharacterized protein LOC135092568 n=1 Tax=Scylla paramamosain TaxID=85552 RepID=UPI0030837BBB